jgi:hypothetical protein
VASGIYKGRFWFSIDEGDYTGAYNFLYKAEKYESVVNGNSWKPAGLIIGNFYQEVTPVMASRGGDLPTFYFESRTYNNTTNLTIGYSNYVAGFSNNDFNYLSNNPYGFYYKEYLEGAFDKYFRHESYKSRDGYIYYTPLNQMFGPPSETYVNSEVTGIFDYEEEQVATINDTIWMCQSGRGDIDITPFGEHIISIMVFDRSYFENSQSNGKETVLSIDILNRYKFNQPGYQVVRHDLRNFIKPFYNDLHTKFNPQVYRFKTYVRDIDNIYMALIDEEGLKAVKFENGAFVKLASIPNPFATLDDWKMELLSFKDKPVYICFRNKDFQTVRLWKMDETGLSEVGAFTLPNGAVEEYGIVKA